MSGKNPRKRGRTGAQEIQPCPRGIMPGTNAKEFIARIYSPDFFEKLASILRCEPFDSEKMNEIRHMAFVYISQTNQENAGPGERWPEYRKLVRISEQFIAAITEARERGFASDMADTARLLSKAGPHADFRKLSGAYNPDDIHIQDLLRLADLANMAAKRRARLRPGRKANWQLAILVSIAADFFETDLNLPFSIDHNKPAKPSKAFDFVRSIVEPLADVSDQEIITAIRNQLAVRRRLKEAGGPSNPLTETVGR